ncbi:MAG: hypothetical protein V9G04_02030 [Nocardioides sp.]|jgi:hypothetical protein
MSIPLDPLVVPSRFCGPPNSGNGGWTSGALAGLLPDAGCPEDRSEAWPTIEITLRQPPPLDTLMPLTHADGITTALRDGAAVATGRLVEAELVAVAPVSAEVAHQAEERFAGVDEHPFPTCYTCGPDAPGGLHIFPSPLVEGDLSSVAALWTPDETELEDWHSYGCSTARTSLANVWAALDCPGGWAGGFPEITVVLGRMTARVDALPRAGEQHVIVAEGRGREGRKSHTATTIYDEDGRQVATAEHVWIQVDRADFV